MASCNPEPPKPPTQYPGGTNTYIPDFGGFPPAGGFWGVRSRQLPLNQFVEKSLLEIARQIEKDTQTPEDPK